MKVYFPYLFFLLRFLLVFIALTILYQLYLSAYVCTNCIFSDPITEIMAKKSADLLSIFGFDIQSFQDPYNAVKFLIEGNNIVSRVNEGCNGLSVMIIFVSFVLGLYAKAIQTFLFLVFGLVIIFVSNIFRISLLNYLILYFPKYTDLAHDVVFPSIIYGTVFLLWIFWVLRFALPYWKNKLINEKQ